MVQHPQDLCAGHLVPVLTSLVSPVPSSVAALLTIFLVALC